MRPFRIVLAALLIGLAAAAALVMRSVGSRAPTVPATVDTAAVPQSNGDDPEVAVAPNDPPSAVSVRAPAGTEAATEDARVTANAPRPSGEPATATVTVQVTSAETGAPVARARIYVQESATDDVWTVDRVDGSEAELGQAPLTGDDGHARLAVAADTPLHLLVRADDLLNSAFDSERRELGVLAPGEERDVAVRLRTEPDLTFWGRVVAREDGRPLPDARVMLSSSGAWADIATDGTFLLSVRSWTQAWASAAAPDRAPSWFRVAAGHETAERAFTIELDRAATLAVEVRSGADAPVAGAVATARTYKALLAIGGTGRMRAGLSGEHEVTATTDAEGRALLAGLAPRVRVDLRVDPGADDSSVVEIGPIVLEPGEERALEVRVGAAGMLRGRLVDETGRAYSRRNVWALRAPDQQERMLMRWLSTVDWDRTDTDGRFELELAPGLWHVGAAPPAEDADTDPEAPAPVATAVQVPAGGLPGEVTIVAPRGLWITGTVLGPGDEAVDRAHLQATQRERHLWTQTRLGDGGHFALGPLVPGAWELTVDPHEAESGRSEPVLATAGATDVVIRLSAGATITGVVLGSEADLAAPSLMLVGPMAADGSPALLQSMTALGGTFELASLAPGEYHLTVSADSGRIGAARVDLAVGEERELELRLDPGGRVRVLSQRAEETFLILRTGGAIAGFAVLEPGSAQVIVVPVGDVEVLLWQLGETRGLHLVETVAVSEGAEAEVVLED